MQKIALLDFCSPNFSELFCSEILSVDRNSSTFVILSHYIKPFFFGIMSDTVILSERMSLIAVKQVFGDFALHGSYFSERRTDIVCFFYGDVLLTAPYDSRKRFSESLIRRADRAHAIFLASLICALSADKPKSLK